MGGFGVPGMHKTLPEARILPNLPAVERITVRMGGSGRTGTTMRGWGQGARLGRSRIKTISHLGRSGDNH